jgi:glycosyltransferase involved in cell wall biosynthesis
LALHGRVKTSSRDLGDGCAGAIHCVEHMKVLIISAAFPPMRAGEATNAAHLSERLAARGLDVHVLTSCGHSARSAAGATIHPLMRHWSWAEVPRLARFLKRCSPDIVYLMYLGWTYDHQFMSTFLPTIVKRVLPGVAIVTRFENVAGAGPQANSWLSRAIRKAVADYDATGDVDYQFGTLLRDSDAIVLLSGRHEAILEQHLAGVGTKCTVIPPPFNVRICDEASGRSRERGRQMLGLDADAFAIAYIGYVYPGKGIETLLRAFAQVSRELSSLKLVIIGGSLSRALPGQPTYIDDLKTLCHQLDVAGNVTWTGEFGWDDDEASYYLRAADLCVLPFETGVKLNNSSFSSAAAHGLPIVTTYDDLLEPQFLHGTNVWLCPPKSPDALAAAIQTLSNDAILRTRLGEGALRLAHEWYSWDTAIQKTLMLLGRHTSATSHAAVARARQPASRHR